MSYSRLSLAVVLLVAAMPTPAGAQQAISIAAARPDRALNILEYRERLAAAVARLRPNARILRVDDRTLKIVEGGRAESQINIENGYDRYRADPDALEHLLAQYAKLALATETATETVDQLVIIVRPSNYVSSTLLPQAGSDKLIAPRAMAGDLSFFLAVDSPETIRIASTDDLARWGIREAAAWDRAASNIRSRLGELAMGPIEGQPDSAAAVGAGSGLAPSLLAEPISCSREHPQGVESQIVLVVSRDAYIFGVPSDPGSMRRFWSTAKPLLAAPAPFSATPLTCDNGRWRSVAVP